MLQPASSSSEIVFVHSCFQIVCSYYLCGVMFSNCPIILYVSVVRAVKHYLLGHIASATDLKLLHSNQFEVRATHVSVLALG